MERWTAGDTTVVRTVSGSAWGEARTLELAFSIGEAEGDERYMFGIVSALAELPDRSLLVLDRQAATIRHYDAEGHHLRDIGRAGEGPGEFDTPSALAVLSDGRIAVLDGGGGRTLLFHPDGTAAGSIPIPPAIFASELRQDENDHLFIPVRGPAEMSYVFAAEFIVRVDPDDSGAQRDTIRPPVAGTPPEQFELPGFRTTVPLSPRELFAFAPPDRFAVGWSGRYQVLLHRVGDGDGAEQILRVEREVEAVPMSAGEREWRARRAVQPLRTILGRTAGDMPTVPAVKPAFTELRLLDDGRLVVERPLASISEEDPSHDPSDPLSSPERWRTPTVLDFFAEDGTFLGELHFPSSIRSSSPPPILGDGYAWAVYTDELGVARIGRFRVIPVDTGEES